MLLCISISTTFLQVDNIFVDTISLLSHYYTVEYFFFFTFFAFFINYVDKWFLSFLQKFLIVLSIITPNINNCICSLVFLTTLEYNFFCCNYHSCIKFLLFYSLSKNSLFIVMSCGISPCLRLAACPIFWKIFSTSIFHV